jgi:hypothetical protein
MNTNYYFASTYGSGDYNTSVYNGTTSTSTGTGTNGGVLTNTGIAIAGIVTIACVIIFIAMAVKIWKRPAKKTPPTDTAQ